MLDHAARRTSNPALQRYTLIKPSNSSGGAEGHLFHNLTFTLLETDAQIATFSGDADTDGKLVAAARAANLFVCDAAFPDALCTPGHLTPGRAGAIAQEAGVKTLCLTHFYPECEGHDLRAQAAATFAGEVVLAHDLRRFALG